MGTETSARTTAADDGSVTVTVLGEVDFSNSDEVARVRHDAIVDWSPQMLLIDLADATFIDSTGLGALIEGYRTESEHGTDFRVINPSVTFRRVLSVTDFSDFSSLVKSDGLEQATGA